MRASRGQLTKRNKYHAKRFRACARAVRKPKAVRYEHAKPDDLVAAGMLGSR